VIATVGELHRLRRSDPRHPQRWQDRNRVPQILSSKLPRGSKLFRLPPKEVGGSGGVPIKAVYTRTITSPRWGLRSTGQLAGAVYTFLIAEDRGGGSVILPGPDFSILAPQELSSRVAVGRVRRDFGSSFVSLLTGREIEGGGHNRIFGPDFEWRPTGTDVLRRVIPGVELQGFWYSYFNVEHRTERVRAGSRHFDSDYFVAAARMSPAQWIGGLGLDVTIGDDVDFDNERPGGGATVVLQAIVRPTDHLSLQLNGSRRWLDVSRTGTGPRDQRLFTAEVARLKATYTFTSRAFLRLIGQRIRTELDPDLYTFRVPERDESFTGSALFAYKLNRQTVLFLGYGRYPRFLELFLKISYAFQR
jgi:hypothetical protein